ncbi:Vha26 [Symbiodinium sp. CCMP2592]|nr:Vha26 [Symbiodinium sp. CCMP2592]
MKEALITSRDDDFSPSHGSDTVNALQKFVEEPTSATSDMGNEAHSTSRDDFSPPHGSDTVNALQKFVEEPMSPTSDMGNEARSTSSDDDFSPSHGSDTVNALQKFVEEPMSPTSDMGNEVPEEERSLLPHGSHDSQKSAREAEMDHQVCGTRVILNIYDVTQSTGVQWINTLFAYEHAPVKLGGLFHVGVQVGDEERMMEEV